MFDWRQFAKWIVRRSWDEETIFPLSPKQATPIAGHGPKLGIEHFGSVASKMVGAICMRGFPQITGIWGRLR